MENSTEIVFVLQGLNDTKSNKLPYFSITLLVYLFTVFANLTLIVTVILNRDLHEPMFIFLCNLCVNGICGVSAFYPKILVDLSSDESVIPYKACLAQIVGIYIYVFCEITTLTVMGYDRYIAICNPLYYHSVMTHQRVMQLMIFTWLSSVIESIFSISLLARLPLCGFNIEKLYCTTPAVLKLSCVDATINSTYGSVLMVFHVSEAIVIFVSYVKIIKASVRSAEERNKFVHTCFPHLLSLANFSIAIIFDILYDRHGSFTSLHALRSVMSLAYLLVPPILNPLIYGLKMNQIRRSILRICSRQTDTLK